MKAKLEFDLNDPDDRIEHMRCVKSLDMAIVLWQIQHNLRKQCEHSYNPDNYDEDNSIAFSDGIDTVFERINELIHDHGVNLDELVQ